MGHTATDLQLALFAAAVKELAAGKTGIRLDPHPHEFTTSPSNPPEGVDAWLRSASSRGYLPVDSATVAARTAVLSDLGVEAVQAIPGPERCDALLTPVESKDVSGCPSERHLLPGFAVLSEEPGMCRRDLERRRDHALRDVNNIKDALEDRAPEWRWREQNEEMVAEKERELERLEAALAEARVSDREWVMPLVRRNYRSTSTMQRKYDEETALEWTGAVMITEDVVLIRVGSEWIVDCTIPRVILE